MLLGRLILRSLRHYWRSHLAAAMTAMICTAVLTGALLVGDSVKAGLRQLAALRLGRIHYSLAAREVPFSDRLANRIAARTGLEAAAVLTADGLLERPDGTLRINRIRILGVDEAFFAFGSAGQAVPTANRMAVNETLWQRLGGQATDMILRLDNPSALSRDLIFASDKQARTTLAVRIGAVVPDTAMGRFGLQAEAQTPLNLFVPRQWLSEQLGLKGQANLLLAAASETSLSSAEQLNCALKDVVKLEDLGLELTELPGQKVVQLQSRQLFISEAAGKAALACGQNSVGIFTYFVNGLSRGGHTTPYSMVSALGSRTDDGLFGELADDEIVINEWLADDLEAEPGDMLEMDYYGLGDTNTLIEKRHAFRVRQVVPMMGFAADATLMPPFPGLSDAENCQNWDPAIPVQLSRIRAKDEAYWDRYRGTPKAFLSLKAGQTLWQNRFGNLTAIRWPIAENNPDTLAAQLAQTLDPAQFGLFFEDAAAHGQRAGAGSSDFSGLFAGLSMFLILSCAVICALIFVFTIEQRSGQAGILLAMGWPKKAIYRLFMTEGALLALLGAVIGAGVGMLYTLLMMQALRTIWQGAAAGAALQFYAAPSTLLVGAVAGFTISFLAMGAGLFNRLKKTPIELLSAAPSDSAGRFSRTGRRIRLSLLAVCLIFFVASFYVPATVLSEEAFFFLSGSILLVIFVLWAMEMMHTIAHRFNSAPSSPLRLVAKNIIRRPGRSLAVFLTVACGVFMVLGVGLNRKSIDRLTARDSGTGGFALWVETALPLPKAPDAAFAKALAQETGVDTLAFVTLRQHRGDDASCLNPNRAQSPTLLGVNPEDFSKCRAFSFRAAQSLQPGNTSPWELLSGSLGETTVPAIGDYATVYWGLGLNLGDTLPMQDDRGRKFNLKIVGILKESIFQGRLLINERHFIERFASDDGYGVLLVDASGEKTTALAAALTRTLADYGGEVVATETILRDFLQVENTYLAIFLVLGGLGLVLGSAGAGMVLLFNVMDRRAELAMMQAVGFSRAAIGKLLLAEHLGLFAAGLLAGGCSALLAVLPSLKAADAQTATMGLLLPVVILASGFVWVTLAGQWALKRNLLDSLRNE